DLAPSALAAPDRLAAPPAPDLARRAASHRPSRRGPARTWTVRAALVVGLSLLVLAFAPGSAPAATYRVESCTNGSVAGWAPFAHGLWSTWGVGCGLPGGSMRAGISHYAGSTAGWTFTAPADTELAGFRLSRSYALAANQPYGTMVVSTITGPAARHWDWRPNYGGAVTVGPESNAADGLRGEKTLTIRVDCGGGLSCTGDSSLQIHGGSIDLRDDVGPTLGGVFGSLLATGALKGTRTIAYAAQDKGGGVRTAELLVDGAVVAGRAADCSFALPVPCPLSESGTLTLDTTRLAEGEHEAKLVVADATLVNRAQHGPFTITVDNLPAPAATTAPRISGGPTLHGDDGTWTGANLTFDRRWQRLEDSTWQDVATGPVYVPGPDDAGHRLRFRIRATNAEGTGEAVSEPTARLPEAPTPIPTSTATPTATPTSTPAAPIVVAAQPVPAPVATAPASPGRLSVAFAATGRSTVTLRWGERRKVSGVLVDADGRALAGERVAIAGTLRVSGATALPLGHVTTDAAGRFAYLSPAGASRTLTFTRGESTATATVHVVPRITVRVTRAGAITGRVSGAPPGIAKRVQLQALRGRTWRTFATTRLRPTGGTFAHQPRTLPHRVRARVLAEPGWPFVTGASLSTRGK
ncbi:hypothetical protein OJ998_24645, partial [Solirubrobacter taibaiensis]|nr:hypothetical protein [Solirubrobacter taibaiensis]